MKVYSIDVRKDIMEPKNIVIPAGNAKLHKLQFAFDDAWEGLPKVCQFSSGGKSYPVILEEDGCVIPSDMAAKPGAFCFGVYGYETGSAVGTSDLATLKIRISTNLLNGLIVDGAYSGTDDEVTPTLFEQLGTIVQKHIDDEDNPHKVTAEQTGALTPAVGDDRYLRVGKPLRFDEMMGKLTGDVFSAEFYAESNINVISRGQLRLDSLAGIICTGEVSVPPPSLEDSAANKRYVDSKIPTKVSQLTNDRGYITESNFTVNTNMGAINATSYLGLYSNLLIIDGTTLNLSAGTLTISASKLDFQRTELSNIGVPTAGTSATNKSYVDGKADELNAKISANADGIADNADAIAKNSNAIAQNTIDIAGNDEEITKQGQRISALDEEIGDISTALDGILAIQTELLGGATA